MRVCFVQKILPLGLCFAVGVGLSTAGESLRSAAGRRSAARTEASESHSRTWLIVKTGLPRAPMAQGGNNSFVSSERFSGSGAERLIYSARLRARFKSDGTVSAVSPEGLFGVSREAAAAVERIRFVPPTEDGRPLAVTADVACEMVDAYPRPGARGTYYVYAPNVISLTVRIVSVEGASSQEGWRVVYE